MRSCVATIRFKERKTWCLPCGYGTERFRRVGDEHFVHRALRCRRQHRSRDETESLVCGESLAKEHPIDERSEQLMKADDEDAGDEADDERNGRRKCDLMQLPARHFIRHLHDEQNDEGRRAVTVGTICDEAEVDQAMALEGIGSADRALRRARGLARQPRTHVSNRLRSVGERRQPVTCARRGSAAFHTDHLIMRTKRASQRPVRRKTAPCRRYIKNQ